MGLLSCEGIGSPASGCLFYQELLYVMGLGVLSGTGCPIMGLGVLSGAVCPLRGLAVLSGNWYPCHGAGHFRGSGPSYHRDRTIMDLCASWQVCPLTPPRRQWSTVPFPCQGSHLILALPQQGPSELELILCEPSACLAVLLLLCLCGQFFLQSFIHLLTSH